MLSICQGTLFCHCTFANAMLVGCIRRHGNGRRDVLLLRCLAWVLSSAMVRHTAGSAATWWSVCFHHVDPLCVGIILLIQGPRTLSIIVCTAGCMVYALYDRVYC